MLHNFFETALTAFVYDLNIKLQPYNAYIKQKFPILIMNTGDEVFIQNINPDNGVKLYNRIPRMIIDLEGLNVLIDQLTNPHILGQFIDTDIVTGAKSKKLTNVRRVPIEFTANSQVYFSNIFEFLSFVEILLCTTYRNNIFKFFYNDMLFTGSYNYVDSFDPQVNKSLSFDSEKRQRILPMSFNIDLQFPAYDYYNSKSMIDGGNDIQHVMHRMHSNGVFDIDSAESVTLPQET